MLTPDSSPLRNFSFSALRKSISKKDFSWSKLFHHESSKVTVVDGVDGRIVDLKELNMGDKFSHGANSWLYHAEYKGDAAAVKLMCVQNDDDDETGVLGKRLEKQFTREVRFLSRLHHPNVIKILTAWKQPPFYFIITEYLPQGSLRVFLRKLEHKSIPLQKLIPFALEIARGMEYIHSQGIIHRDLKPENILIDQNLHLKIADFGIACEETHCDSLADDPGTYRWMAPEVIKHKRYGRKVDVYSFGLILWEMLSGSVPYEDMSPIVAAFAVVDKNLRPPFSDDCPTAMKALIEQCWSLKPGKRPEFWQVVKVLEEFESSLDEDRTLMLVQSSICLDQKKGFLDWIQNKTSTNPHPSCLPMPKFT